MKNVRDLNNFSMLEKMRERERVIHPTKSKVETKEVHTVNEVQRNNNLVGSSIKNSAKLL
jgi:hypothetical protein